MLKLLTCATCGFIKSHVWLATMLFTMLTTGMVSFVRLEAMQYINAMFRDKNKQDEKDKLKTKKT